MPKRALGAADTDIIGRCDRPMRICAYSALRPLLGDHSRPPQLSIQKSNSVCNEDTAQTKHHCGF